MPRVDARQNAGDAKSVQPPYNPYAPPQSPGMTPYAPVDPLASVPCWRDQAAACVYKQAAVLPPRCVKCNAPASHRVQKTLYWHEPWVYFTIFAGVLIYAIVALIMRKQAYVDWGLCDKHKSQRTIGFAVAAAGFLAGLGIMFLGAFSTMPELIVGGLVGMVLLPIGGLILARNVVPKRIDDHYVWLKVGPAFLESLQPPWPRQ
ncbi:MAG: hypothetical protein JNL21_22710 [Myxococcales bacterium]|nr:hypothetical protein [Myxococcales bacterium]